MVEFDEAWMENIVLDVNECEWDKLSRPTFVLRKQRVMLADRIIP